MKKIMRSSSGTITTDALGDGSGTIEMPSYTVKAIRAFVDLGTSTSADVTIEDSDGISLLSVTGVTSDTEYYLVKERTIGSNTYGVDPILSRGDLTVTIANGGDTKTVTVWIEYEL